MIGEPWPGYSPAVVTVVQPGRGSGTDLTLVDIETGDTYSQPVSTGGTGGQWVATATRLSPDALTSSAEILTSPDGVRWTRASLLKDRSLKALAWGEGKWVAAGTVNTAAGESSSIFTSTDLKTWTTVETLPASLQGIVYGAGRWVAVGGKSRSTERVIYTSTDAKHWESEPSGPPAAEHDVLESVAYGQGKWIAAFETEGPFPRFNADSFRTLVSTDGVHWELQTIHTDPSFGGGGRIAYGSGTWLFAPFEDGTGKGSISSSTDGESWTPVRGTPFEEDAAQSIAHGSNKWLGIAGTTGGDTNVYGSSTGTSWSLVGNLPPITLAIAFGGGSGAGASPAPSTVVSKCGTLDEQVASLNEDGLVTSARVSTADPNWARIDFKPRTLVVTEVYRCEHKTWTMKWVDPLGCTLLHPDDSPAAGRARARTPLLTEAALTDAPIGVNVVKRLIAC